MFRHGYSDIIGHEDYIKDKKLVWQKAKDDKDISDTFALLSTSSDDGPMRGKMLPAGKHVIPFEFTLPSQCPGSTANLIPSSWSDYAYVCYRIKVSVPSLLNVKGPLQIYSGRIVQIKVCVGDSF